MNTDTAYRGVFVVVGILGIGAVLLSSYGLYVALTAGPSSGGDGSLLGEYRCAEFDGDPAMPHESSLESPRTVVGDAHLKRFNATATADGVDIEIVADGPLINASASGTDGTRVPVERFPERNRVEVRDHDGAPFRLFLESVSGDTLVRTELDICPPESQRSE